MTVVPAPPHVPVVELRPPAFRGGPPVPMTHHAWVQWFESLRREQEASTYTHPNHSGDVTSVGDGAQTIGAGKVLAGMLATDAVETAKIKDAAVTLAKMANMATESLLGRDTAGAGVPEVLSKAAALALLNCEDGVTLEAWIRPGKQASGGARIIDKTPVGRATGYMLDTYPGNSLRLVYRKPAVVFDARLTPGRWVHVAATIDAESEKAALYIDGKRAKQQ